MLTVELAVLSGDFVHGVPHGHLNLTCGRFYSGTMLMM